MRPFRSTELSRMQPNSVAVRNTGPLEFPLNAHVANNRYRRGMPHPTTGSSSSGASRVTIQGGATESFRFDASVDSVQVFLQTQGRDLHAKIEVLQGANSVRQVVELEEDWGHDRPFSTVLETPGYSSVIRIINTAPMTFPLEATVVAHSFNDDGHCGDPYRASGGPAMGESYDAYDPYGGRRSGNGWSGHNSPGGYQQNGMGGAPYGYGANVY